MSWKTLRLQLVIFGDIFKIGFFYSMNVNENMIPETLLFGAKSARSLRLQYLPILPRTGPMERCSVPVHEQAHGRRTNTK